MSEYFISFFIISGTIFIFLSAVGLIKMPDLYTRMSATTKASTLGVGLILIATAIYSGEIGIISRALIIVLFLFITAPIAAHMIGRAAYFDGVPLWKGTITDQLKGKYDIKSHELKGETNSHSKD